MNANSSRPAGNSTNSSVVSRPLFQPVAAGLASWALISLGFLGLKMLMQERPEFVGQPLRASKAELVQESPRIVARKVSDDVSIVKSIQPEASEIRFAMQGRRDYRGLKTISDMSGQFTSRYTVTNRAEEPIFVLFKCPHPRAASNDGLALPAGGLRLQASVPGVQENAKDAWFWSGTAPAHTSVVIEVGYEVASLKGVTYRIAEQDGIPLNRVRVAFDRLDLGSMRFESGDGPVRATAEPLIWERSNFLGPDFFSASILESRSLFTSLSQLAEIGPLISLLFLLAVIAVIVARQNLTAIQMLTLSAGYALYFPLILYLSSRFSFAWALAIAVLVPGALLVNYARWLMGARLGLLGGPIFLGLYQVFPTLAAFAGWNRGMVLLCLGVVTLWVLISLQNKALRANATTAWLFLALALPGTSRGAEIQVVLPGELAKQVLLPSAPEKKPPLLACEPAQYQIRQEGTHFQVEARLAFQVLRAGELPAPLFAAPVHLQAWQLESPETNLAQIVTVTNRLGLYAQGTGRGAFRFTYRVPVEDREGKTRAQFPLLAVASGSVHLEATRNDLELLTGSLWSRSTTDKTTVYEIGVAGEDLLILEWRGPGGEAPAVVGHQAEGAKEFYGIGLTRSRHLTVINSDGSCTHFAECELPAFQKGEFRLRLAANARLISASLNGTEISAPIVEDGLCRIGLPDRAPEQTTHRLSFRLAYPQVRLGFAGSLERTLPEVFQTVGTLEWVVALPDGFEAQVISSGLEAQRAPADLSAFGDYGSVLKSHPQLHLAKTLAPPGLISLNLKYRQIVPGLYGLSHE